MSTFEPMKKIAIPFLAFLLWACGSEPASNNSNEQKEVTNSQTTDNSEQSMPEPTYIYVVMTTTQGEITLELDSTNAPQTVNNFLSYVDEGFYDGTIFHRVIDNFMVQGGGFTPDGTQKPTKDPIFLESQNGLDNDLGTIAMARTNAPNSATAQFFINIKDNDFLNYAPGNPGYAVFGKVIAGMEVVNEIKKVKTGTFQQFRDWPVEPVVIKSVRRENK